MTGGFIRCWSWRSLSCIRGFGLIRCRSAGGFSIIVIRGFIRGGSRVWG